MPSFLWNILNVIRAKLWIFSAISSISRADTSAATEEYNIREGLCRWAGRKQTNRQTYRYTDRQTDKETFTQI